MKKEANKHYRNIDNLYNHILNHNFTNAYLFYSCFIELVILFKNTLYEIRNIYTKYILFPGLRDIYSV